MSVVDSSDDAHVAALFSRQRPIAQHRVPIRRGQLSRLPGKVPNGAGNRRIAVTMLGRIGVASEHFERCRKLTGASQLRCCPGQVLALNVKAVVIAVAPVPRLPAGEVLLDLPLGSREVSLFERVLH